MMSDAASKLKVKLVKSLDGKFYIPSFQRGYKWERKQVRQLLNDLMQGNVASSYYLQPIVVTERDKEYKDLIDGQQRLTTILLIYKVLENLKLKYDALSEYDVKAPYEIKYDTREESNSDFLQKLSSCPIETLFEESRSNPDTLYMWHAAKEIYEWFGKDVWKMQLIAKALNERVKIIWYELTQDVDPWEKFSDLNVGKIPLTNSELIKALFMRNNGREKKEDDEAKSVIIDQWDSIERDLADERFWSFLTKRRIEDYDTKIDLLFDIIVGKKPDELDDFYTFYKFEQIYSDSIAKEGKRAWNNIYLQYLRLRDWYEDPSNELYHKIGYLVSIDERDKVLNELFEFSKDKTQQEFKNELNRRIKESIDLPKDEEGRSIRFKELRYGENNTLITRILTLFNVLTVQNLADKTQRYSFHHHNSVGGGWSLEHIHAQKSDTLDEADQWTQWVTLHLKSLERFRRLRILQESKEEELFEIATLKEEMEDYLSLPKKEKNKIGFNRIAGKFSRIVVSQDRRTSQEYKDEIANLTLLGQNLNSMLSNSVFDVKRGLIIDALTHHFIPVGTQMVFLKTFVPQDDNQSFFWGQPDRDAYIDRLESTLKSYLPKGYLTEKELRQLHNID